MTLTDEETREVWGLFHDVYATFIEKAADKNQIEQAYWQGKKDGILTILAMIGATERDRQDASGLNDSSPGSMVEVRATELQIMRAQLARAYNLIYNPGDFMAPRQERANFDQWVRRTATVRFDSLGNVVEP